MKTSGNDNLMKSSEVKDNRTPQECSDIKRGDALTHDMKNNGITKENCDITSTCADITRDGKNVRTHKCDVDQTLSSEIVTSPVKRPSPDLVSRDEESINMPNVPSLPDIMVNNDVLTEKEQNSVFRYTVPLPQLMNEISSTVHESSSVTTPEFDRNTKLK